MNTHISITNCSCGALVYVGGNSKQCPSCRNEIIKDWDVCYSENNRVPLMSSKFLVTDIRYFHNEYPKDGDHVFLIRENGQVKAVVWDEVYKEQVENFKVDYYAWLERK